VSKITFCRNSQLIDIDFRYSVFYRVGRLHVVLRGAAERVGRVEAICTRLEAVIAKRPVESALVEKFDLESDRHCRPRRMSGLKFNDRQVSISAL
jgi:hypothetical protein